MNNENGDRNTMSVFNKTHYQEQWESGNVSSMTIPTRWNPNDANIHNILNLVNGLKQRILKEFMHGDNVSTYSWTSFDHLGWNKGMIIHVWGDYSVGRMWVQVIGSIAMQKEVSGLFMDLMELHALYPGLSR